MGSRCDGSQDAAAGSDDGSGADNNDDDDNGADDNVHDVECGREACWSPVVNVGVVAAGDTGKVNATASLSL